MSAKQAKLSVLQHFAQSFVGGVYALFLWGFASKHFNILSKKKRLKKNHGVFREIIINPIYHFTMSALFQNQKRLLYQRFSSSEPRQSLVVFVIAA